jgi:beta-lactamase class A
MNLFSFKWSASLLIILSSFFIIDTPLFASIQEKIEELEISSGGRIGFYAIDTASGQHLQHRENERFPMGCTSKVMGVAAILDKSRDNLSFLSQKVSYTKEDLASWSPITKKHIKSGMTVAQLCAASISYSDNTAMNLLVKQLGGLKPINDFARSIHNKSFRQDNGWPAEALSGGPNNIEDSATPKDMAKSLQALALTNILETTQRTLLISWLKANTTGNLRIRAGLPKDWGVADKTGTGSDYGTTNDIAIVWPPNCAPIIMAIYYTNDDDKKAAKRDDIVASVSRTIINQFYQSNHCIRKNLGELNFKVSLWH